MKYILIASALLLVGCGDPIDKIPGGPNGAVKVFDSGDGSKVYRTCDGTTAIYVLRESLAAKALHAVKDGCAR